MANGEELINQATVFKFIESIFKQQLNNDLKQSLWQEVYGVFNKGITQGLRQETDAVLQAQLNHNVAVFAAFKNHSFQTELVKALVNEQGDLRSFAEYKTLANKISANYNQRWLKTEYDLAVHSANQAAKWQDFEQRKDLYPNLRYEAIDDGRTRIQHKAWDGLVLPINHPFWVTHYPPNDWGCRCDAVQTDEPTQTKDTAGKEVPVKNIPKLPKQFNMNVGQQKKVFDLEEHPYAQLDDETKKALKKQTEANKLQFPYYKAVEGNKNVLKSDFAHAEDLENNIRVAKILANQLNTKIYIRPHVNNISTGIGNKGFSNPEFLIDGLLGDVKRITGKNLSSAYREAYKQGTECLVIENLTDFDANYIINQIQGISKARQKELYLKRIIIIKQSEVVDYKPKKTQ